MVQKLHQWLPPFGWSQFWTSPTWSKLGVSPNGGETRTLPACDRWPPFFLPPVSGNQSSTLPIHHSVGRAEWKWVGWVNSDLIDEQWRKQQTPSNVDITCLKMQMIDLKNTKIVLGEIQRCSKRANADSWVWQMQSGQTSKSRYLQCANTYAWFWQIHEGLPYWWVHWSSVSKVWCWITNNHKEHGLKWIYT